MWHRQTVSFKGGTTARQRPFAEVPSANIQRSVFNRSHSLKTAYDAGYLVPIYADEALPGDTFKMRMSMFTRMQQCVVPIMDNVYIDVFFFAVPMRLIWENWERFNGAQDDPDDSTDFTCPVMTAHTPVAESLSDYLGIPIGNSISYNSFWHRAYNLVWNEWFRDINLQDSVVVDVDDGPDSISDYVLLKRGKRHDYFTSCLPWTQKGTALPLPLGEVAPVQSNAVSGAGTGMPEWDVGDALGVHLEAGQAAEPFDMHGSRYTGSNPDVGDEFYWSDPALEADLSSATAATINELREAFQVQRLLERDARGGTRYTEILRSHFGVISADQRLQRPEWLGGGTCRVTVVPVPSTDSYDTLIAGDLGSYCLATTNQPSFFKSFTEHCVILGLVNARADITYQEGLPRMFSRESRYDFYWPAFAHLGEQAVFNREIYCDGSANDEDAFGYQERYAEYRYKPNAVTGKMRSTYTSPLDQWHLALEFGSLPSLNASFIEDAPPLSRVVKLTNQPEFYSDFWFDLRCARPMPTFSVPGLIDHF